MKLFTALILTLLCSITLAAECPCTVTHKVTGTGPTWRVPFEVPFALVPACTASLVNRADAVTVTAANKSGATVQIANAFKLGDTIELVCNLTNRRN